MGSIFMLALMVLGSMNPAAATDKMEEMFEHTGSCGTQHGKEEDDPDYYSSNSKLPNLPSATGFMGTHGTYRFMTVHEQTAVVIGEGKHGMWRVQSAGYIRVYRTKGEEGIKPEHKEDALDGETASLNDILDKHYTHQDGSNNRNHKHSFGDEICPDTGYLNWLDLSIYHPKFGGKYEDHPAIDLAWYYCQLSGADYPHMGNVWKYMRAQKTANKAGPLGKRAGMDINENFNSILKVELFGHGGVFANVGQGNPDTDQMQKTLDELKSRAQTIDYKRIDDEKIDYEFYMIERGYHNYAESYLIVAFVMDSKVNPKDYSYVRPDGRYYNGLVQRGITPLNTVPKFDPPIYIEDDEKEHTVYGMAAFGHNHPVRMAHGMTGGGCPTKGGDCSTYPWGNSGGGFATDYEEITPICDGIVVDIKYWADLDIPWNSDTAWIGNAGYRTEKVEYMAHANKYGEFEDPYLLDNGIKNPQVVDFTEDGEIVMEAPEKLEDHPVVSFEIDYGVIGDLVNFVEVELDPLPRGCAAEETRDDEYHRYSSAERTSAVCGSILLLLAYYCA